MRSGAKQKWGHMLRYARGGYTIVEVMIVLAVTGALVVSVMLTVAKQQSKTEFSQSVHDIDSQVQDIANDISTGYYAKLGGGDFNCSNQGAGPHITSGVSERGTNGDCIFIGRVLHFAVQGGADKFNIYDLVGVRSNSGQEVTNYTGSHPTVVAPVGNNGIPDNTEHATLQYGLSVTHMYYKTSTGGPHIPIGALGFVSSLSQYSAGQLVSGTPSVNLMPIAGTLLNQDASTIIPLINLGVNDAAPINPAGGVVICFKSSGTDQYGVLTLGSNGRALNTNLQIENGSFATRTTPTMGDCT